MNIAVARIAQDLNIFQILAASEKPLEVEALAATTGAAPKLLGQLAYSSALVTVLLTTRL